MQAEMPFYEGPEDALRAAARGEAGVERVPRDAEVGIERLARDTGVGLLKSAVAVPQAVVGIADIATGGRVGKFLENEDGAVGFRPKEAQAGLEKWYSPETQATHQKVQAADGFVDTAKAMAILAAKGAQSRAEGNGWKNGTIAHLVKPLMPQAKRVKVG